MNHPKPEEWVPYVYGESPAIVRQELSSHLAVCPECRRLVEDWRASMVSLDKWKLARVHKPRDWFAPALRWAAAAACVLALGFGLGRLSTRADVAQLRAALEPQLRQSLREQMVQIVNQELARNSAATLAAASDQTEKLLAAYTAVNDRRHADELERLYLALKKQLDTVAINTEKEFVQLATYQPTRNATTSQP